MRLIGLGMTLHTVDAYKVMLTEAGFRDIETDSRRNGMLFSGVRA
jgi:hypothetical protein